MSLSNASCKGNFDPSNTLVLLFFAGLEPRRIRSKEELRGEFVAFFRSNKQLLSVVSKFYGFDVHGLSDEIAKVLRLLGISDGALVSGTPLLQALFPEYFRFLLSFVGSEGSAPFKSCLKEFRATVDNGNMQLAIVTVCDRSDHAGWASKASICTLLMDCALLVLGEMYADGKYTCTLSFGDDSFDHLRGFAEQFSIIFPEVKSVNKAGEPLRSVNARNDRTGNGAVFVFLPNIKSKTIIPKQGRSHLLELSKQLASIASERIAVENILDAFLKPLIEGTVSNQSSATTPQPAEPTSASEPQPAEPTSASE
jgi:hypothetical protein